MSPPNSSLTFLQDSFISLSCSGFVITVFTRYLQPFSLFVGGRSHFSETRGPTSAQSLGFILRNALRNAWSRSSLLAVRAALSKSSAALRQSPLAYAIIPKFSHASDRPGWKVTA